MSFIQRLKDAQSEILYGVKELGAGELDELFDDMKRDHCRRCEEENGYRCCDPRCDWR